jgi:rRNA maturation endonuclease Nob1
MTLTRGPVIIRIEQLTSDGKNVFKVWYECSDCRKEVFAHDVYCRWCGGRFGMVPTS